MVYNPSKTCNRAHTGLHTDNIICVSPLDQSARRSSFLTPQTQPIDSMNCHPEEAFMARSPDVSSCKNIVHLLKCFLQLSFHQSVFLIWEAYKCFIFSPGGLVLPLGGTLPKICLKAGGSTVEIGNISSTSFISFFLLTACCCPQLKSSLGC